MFQRVGILSSQNNKIFLRLLLSLALILSILPTISAPAFAAPLQQSQPIVVTLPPNGTASVSVNGFCLNCGLPFPGATLNFSAAAPDNVQAVIAYALEQGLVSSNVYGVQLAIWNLANAKPPLTLLPMIKPKLCKINW